MHRIKFGNDHNTNLGDSMNMVETPEDSPEREIGGLNNANTKREVGGRFNHMA
jgi:hypothetical protein